MDNYKETEKDMGGQESLRAKLEPVYDILNWSYIAKNYFEKSETWLIRRINGSSVNGKMVFLSEEDKKILINALQEISRRLQEIGKYHKNFR